MNRDESCCDHHWPSIFWLESRILCLLNSAVLGLCFVNISGSSCWRFWHSTQSDGGWVSLSDPAVVIHAKLLQCIHMIRLYVWFSSYTLSPSSFFAVCVCVWEGRLYLFCKGADSAIFPRVISGKVDQIKARVEHNAVVSASTRAHTDAHARFSWIENTESMSPAEHLSHDSEFQIVWFHWFPKIHHIVTAVSMVTTWPFSIKLLFCAFP